MRESLAHRGHDQSKRLEAKRHLKYPAVQFNGAQVEAVGRGLAEIVRQLQVTVYACAIMPDHVHLVTGRHARHAEDIAGFLKRAATRRLTAEGLHPLEAYRQANGRIPSPWAGRGWYVYLETPEQLRQRIRYVEGNPVKSGLPRQRWSFVVASPW